MQKALIISIRFTLVTTLLLGIAYPLAVTAFGHLVFRDRADGQLITRNGQVIGSRIIGQSFSSDKYFHSRPSAAGNGYDATSSGGSNLAASNQKLVSRIQGDVAKYQQDGNSQPVPIDLVTVSGSGLDPDISPAAALFQVKRVAQARNLTEDEVHSLVESHIQPRQFGVLGEPRVNVLELNLALDQLQR
ncbi:potassium-transporting ATPase subunit KdpC [Alloacidobacterium dinghuense]|uniref:Potassium-transporting ATPase KdpC subunit n=1 Tax=Alloacidobacterium dinghuense TaxID=2763107 RepID=A0A7G8BPJ4_9BACT|nr:potassium-transporting ATPase subunit KdpC [Alloacidobacterium dinghuense]QNI34464.1 potassium-transporting ATPase subunit KdpC [Alloacidobacterium dinghuense]